MSHEKISLIPSFAAAANILIMAFEDGTPEAVEYAKAELRDWAKMLDSVKAEREEPAEDGEYTEATYEQMIAFLNRARKQSQIRRDRSSEYNRGWASAFTVALDAASAQKFGIQQIDNWYQE